MLKAERNENADVTAQHPQAAEPIQKDNCEPLFHGTNEGELSVVDEV
jgi:hypothetical protein